MIVFTGVLGAFMQVMIREKYPRKQVKKKSLNLSSQRGRGKREGVMNGDDKRMQGRAGVTPGPAGVARMSLCKRSQ